MRKLDNLFIISIFSIFGGCTLLIDGYKYDEVRVESMLERGVFNLRNLKLKDAEANFRLVLENTYLDNSDISLQHSVEALDGLGCIAFINKNFLSAQDFFYRAIELDPTYSEAYGHLAMVYELQGKKKAAVQLYEASLRNNPNDFKIRGNYAAFLYENGKTDEGLKMMHEVSELSDKNIIAVKNIKYMSKIGVKGGH
jgi:tetratricopeptide (TPR) repeat protein